MNYGLSEHQIKEIIMRSINKNPDLAYYIDNDYIYELVEAIVDGVSYAIERNTNEVIREITRKISLR